MNDVAIITTVLTAPQCSVPCGYGIQSRPVSCMGPSKPEPLSPLLCMHLPKPITIQGCNMGGCRADGPVASTTLSHTPTQPHRMGHPSLPSATEAVTIPQTTTTIPTPKPS